MISMSLPLKVSNWKSVSFASTLYLSPILDLLLHQIPEQFHPEIRLGLQEALVNAAKHGNRLDPTKTVEVKFCYRRTEYSWIVCDQGDGFAQIPSCPLDKPNLPPEEAENGRGLCILDYIFDQVRWNTKGTEVSLYKHMSHPQTSITSKLMLL